MTHPARVFVAVMLALLLVSGSALTVYAQGGENLSCQGLSEADCAILLSASDAMHSVTSFEVPAWSVALDFAAEDASGALAASGSGVVAVPEEVSTALAPFQDAEAPVRDMLLGLLDDLDAETLVAYLDDILLSLSVDELIVDVPDTSLNASGELLVKDGALYLNLPSPAGEQTWFGDTLEVSEYELAQIDAALAELRVALLKQDADAMFEEMAGMTELQDTMMAIIAPYVVTTRGPDEVVDGQTMAAFTTVLDFKALLSDPELPAQLMAVIEQLAGEDPTVMEDGELNETQLQFALIAFNLLIDEASFSSTQWIGLDDGDLYHTAAEVALQIDTSLLGSESVGPISIAFDYALDFANFNGVTGAAVAAPADYYPLDDLEAYLVGTPEMIDGALEPGDSIDDALSYDDTADYYIIALDAGQTVSVSVSANAYVTTTIYDPDGFKAESGYVYGDEPVTFTALDSGMYIITVEGYSTADYTLSVEVE